MFSFAEERRGHKCLFRQDKYLSEEQNKLDRKEIQHFDSSSKLCMHINISQQQHCTNSINADNFYTKIPDEKENVFVTTYVLKKDCPIEEKSPENTTSN